MRWQILACLFLASLQCTDGRPLSLAGRPLSSGEQAAVGDALSKALGVMSGKVKADDKFSICMRMFPDGPPADADTSATWQSCKDELPGRRGSLLLRGSSRSTAVVNGHSA
mmetsp:Transcript_44470/g.105385  ORF Transcript_44470/g.105385 Transcript_44470/m.105385 type:complete len:111 (-) Transcript_44470:136-468(-)|eukprot:CAMPEP_0178415214 /NCGR_PEP_ID=MMETSP0689_2-20121128/23437_1 /TAXON_ID=160604 /ORGANISM="Amphidinium massartii, Strain CS-259" /LENGTH=110 /DNA_ID=CAMNT_0020036529 /DNA_START=74 /DNA_END=406 /DNA_ORIENTATION=+